MPMAHYHDPSSAVGGHLPAPSVAVKVSSSDHEVSEPQPLHRLAEVRRAQNVSLRNVARHLQIDLATAREQEQSLTDLRLSDLYAWQQVLDVPIADLLVESNDPLSTPVLKRAQLLRLMKTVKAIEEQSNEPNIQRMAQMMREQLLGIMPELEEITAWPSVGQYRDAKDVGQAAYRRFPDSVSRNLEDG